MGSVVFGRQCAFLSLYGGTVNRKKLATVIGGATIAAAIAYFTLGSSSPPSTDDRGKSKVTASTRAAPVTVSKAKVEDFRIRRRTIGIIESPGAMADSW